MIYNKHRKRFSRVVLLMALATLAIFFIAIRPTMRLHEEAKAAQQIQETSSSYPSLYANLVKQQKQLDAYFSSGTKEDMVEDGLFNKVTQYCNDYSLYLQAYPSLAVAEDYDSQLQTQEVIVVGDFADIVRLIRKLEDDKGFFIHSTAFTTEVDKTTETLQLSARIYCQRIIR